MSTVLVVDGATYESADVICALVSAGYFVVRCFPLASGDQPCAWAATGHCSLDDGPVDVVVDVHTSHSAALAPRELGLICSARAGVPAVIVTDGSNPLPNAAFTTPRANVVRAVDGAVVRASVRSSARPSAVQP